ncbi:MAG: hypothetical protein GX053_06170 [Tissierella sp.]|nr:hypothetical protein [Tissierella sp.]
MHLRRLVAVFLCFIMFISFGGQVHAIPNSNLETFQRGKISPFMVYIVDAGATLSISSTGKAVIDSYLLGDSRAVTKIEIKTELQYYINGRWTTRNTWTSSSNNNYTTIDESTQLSKGYLYRALSTVTAYSGSASETQTVISREVRY